MTLRDQNIGLLEQGIDLLRVLDGALYGASGETSGVGAHVRHCIDCYRCFLRGVAGLEAGGPAAVCEIDYDARERQAAIEADPAAALRTLIEIADELACLEVSDTQAVEVRVDQPPGSAAPAALQGSTVGRELQFLISHTTHHYALIALLLKSRGVALEPGFGVAPSTLAHQRRCAALAHVR